MVTDVQHAAGNCQVIIIHVYLHVHLVVVVTHCTPVDEIPVRAWRHIVVVYPACSVCRAKGVAVEDNWFIVLQTLELSLSLNFLLLAAELG